MFPCSWGGAGSREQAPFRLGGPGISSRLQQVSIRSLLLASLRTGTPRSVTYGTASIGS